MSYFIIIIIGILVGSIPNYLISMRISLKLGNNRSWTKNIIDFTIDVAKGLLIVVLAKYILNLDFIGIVISLFICLVSHSLFQGLRLKLRDGQFVMLAGLSLFLPIIVILWGLVWLISFAYKRNRIFSQLSTIVLTGLVAVTSPEILNNTYWYSNPLANSNSEFSTLVGLLFTTLLITQIDNVKIYLKK